MMASAPPSTNKTCPMCLEPQDVLKVVGSCHHSFCTRCLTGHLDRHKADDEAFPCPICNVLCVLPGGDMNNLPAAGAEETEDADITDSQTVDACSTTCVAAPRGRNDSTNLDDATVLDVKCQICHHNKKDVQAVNHCPKCDQLHLCEECTATHARNKATKDHVVVPLRAPATESDAHCITHDATLTKYCCDCQQPMCKIGMMLEHGEHDIEEMGETIKRRIKEVEGIYQQQMGNIQGIQCFKMQLAALKTDLPNVDRQKVLEKEIEDHANKFMDGIVTWKENMKEEVKKKFQVVKDIPEAYDTASKVLKKLEKPLEKAADVFSATSHDPSYLARLTSLQKNLESVPQEDAEMDVNRYWFALQELFQRDIDFCPRSPTSSLGKLSLGKLETTIKGREYRSIRQSMNNIHDESTNGSIASVAHLGSKLAIANPISTVQSSDSIHIYNLPGEFCRTLKDHVGPIYDMSSTTDGKLVVLSNGTDGVSPCSIKVLDPETGNMVTTHNLDVEKPMSLGVSPENWYYILGGQGKRQITAVNVNGVVEYTEILKVKPRVKDLSRISCGWSKIFVMGENRVEVLDRKDGKLAKVVTISQYIDHENEHPKDVYASHFDNLFLVDYDQERRKPFLLRYLWHEQTDEWECYYQKLNQHSREEEGENRISGTGNSIVVSNGKEFRVFQLKF